MGLEPLQDFFPGLSTLFLVEVGKICLPGFSLPQCSQWNQLSTDEFVPVPTCMKIANHPRRS